MKEQNRTNQQNRKNPNKTQNSEPRARRRLTSIDEHELRRATNERRREPKKREDRVANGRLRQRDRVSNQSEDYRLEEVEADEPPASSDERQRGRNVDGGEEWIWFF
ncbi:hypothetical protein S245_024300 [Arachis hypogaea]|uniref:Uncharacterized protein n=1 Tax=Arachis hypogaea TaxID=3818 RepID=A0A6B9VBR9_ARAHY|nr:uncharacterized protein DS421_19g655080 [Arachis hypogaea]